jgi:uncharacterized protein YjiS (DUF1127 family)
MKRDSTETDMTGFSSSADTRATARPEPKFIAQFLRNAFAWLAACRETARQRHALELLDDDRLRDIGLTRADVAREAGRNPWDL